jgi:citrate lyase subunit beta/citryl-CoA lyase
MLGTQGNVPGLARGVRDSPRLRSQLYVPGDRSRWFAVALRSGADALIFDLEDAVPLKSRARARSEVAAFVAEHRRELPLFVRVAAPSTPAFLEDVRSVVAAGAFGIVIPKVLGVLDVQIAARLLDWLEDARPDDPATVVVPILETATAIADARAIGAASGRVAYMGALAPKEGDVQRAIGYRWSPDGRESLAFRAQVLLDARAAGVPNPMTGLWTDVEDLSGLRAFAAQSRGLGYEGMVVIHPTHVPIVNDAFDTTEAELERYRKLVSAASTAQAEGRSVLRFEGHMIDTAMVNTAKAALARATARGSDPKPDAANPDTRDAN